jgi:phospholipid transport system substrate-binding protein
MMTKPISFARRSILAAALVAPFLAAPAFAADPAETFVNDNIQKGMAILNNKGLTKQQRRDQFEQFMLGLTDLKRIADFTLGRYRATTSPADLAAFDVAFQNFAVATYQSYFSKYTGQSLKVTNSTQAGPTDYRVVANVIDPADHSGKEPLEVTFRVRTDRGKPVVTDVAVNGAFLSIAQQAQFVGFLGQNNGNVKLLIAHLADVTNDLAKTTN